MGLLRALGRPNPCRLCPPLQPTTHTTSIIARNPAKVREARRYVRLRANTHQAAHPSADGRKEAPQRAEKEGRRNPGQCR